MRIRAVSLDVTGTLVAHRYPVSQAYAMCAVAARMASPPTAEELRPAFKAAWREVCEEKPCFGYYEQRGGRRWWKDVVKRTLERAGKECDEKTFERFFRRVYQHYGSPDGYSVFPDVVQTLEALSARGLLLGVTSNTATRTIETTLPLTNLAEYFHWFVCSADVGFEKPHPSIFEATLAEARFWDHSLAPENVLHVGDNLAADYHGARAAGMHALYLDRVGGTTNFQDWLVGPDYPGKSNPDNIRQHTVRSLTDVIPYLDDLALSDDDDDDDAEEFPDTKVQAAAGSSS